MRRSALLIVVSIALAASVLSSQAPGRSGSNAAPARQMIALPNAAGSLKIAVLGDFGTGAREQYELAAQMAKVHTTFPYELVLLVGDNIYGSERPQDFKKKFEEPYKPLLDAGVKFYASLGNHDSREQRYYKPFNMEGKLYYSFKGSKQSVRFFALESTYPEPAQLAWLEKELRDAKEDWKIVYFHHPLYSSGERHGSDTALRDVLEPMLTTYNVSIAFTGHDHFYERVKPQRGILYFVTGSGGKLRAGNIDRSSGLTAAGLDTDLAFLVGEFTGDTFTFQAFSRTGPPFDTGTFTRRRND